MTPPLCSHCSGIQHGTKAACPLCGRGLACAMPTKDEIRSACVAIRDSWCDARLRQCELYAEWEPPHGKKCGDGMRRRDKEDGRET